jgi:hypothetical protein
MFSDSEIPEGFLCPITNDVMQNPVIDHEGNTYEETAIKEWLFRRNESPVTRSPLSLQQLTPNRALKDVIEKFIVLRTRKLSERKIDPPVNGKINEITFYSLDDLFYIRKSNQKASYSGSSSICNLLP